jgi:hypothetical protein
MRLFLALLVAQCVGLLVARLAAAHAPPCDPEEYAELEAALAVLVELEDPSGRRLGQDDERLTESASAEPLHRRFDFAASAVVEVCVLPEPVGRALREIALGATEERIRLVMPSLLSEHALLTDACGPDATALLDQAGRLDSPEREAHFIDGCAPLLEVASRASLLAQPLARLVVTAVVWSVLRAEGEPHAQELSRLLVGLGLTRRPAP